MKTIEKAAIDYCSEAKDKVTGKGFILRSPFESFKAGVEFALQYISVEDELPEALKRDDEGIFYSEYLLIKIKGYEHPFVGFYVKANDDEFFDFIQDYIQKWINQEDIIGWRLIDLK